MLGRGAVTVFPRRVRALSFMKPAAVFGAVKTELSTYQRGFILFGKDVALTNRFVTSRPRSLASAMRRSRHVVKTSKDMLKLVPLVALIIAPGGGIVLPILVRG